MRDYAELVKALNEISNKTSCYYCHGESLDCKTAGCYISDAADAIEELLAAVPHWISVEERLPENGKFVLVSDGDDIDTACRYKALTPDEVETFFWDSVLEVTHWMPLPEPPKEDAE